MVEVYDRKARQVLLKQYCHCAKEHDFMEVVEWANGEGMDFNVGDAIVSMTYGQFKALTVLVNYED